MELNPELTGESETELAAAVDMEIEGPPIGVDQKAFKEDDVLARPEVNAANVGLENLEEDV